MSLLFSESILKPNGIFEPMYPPGEDLNFFLFFILNFSENKSIFGVSKYPNVGKQLGGMIPLSVTQPIRFLFLKFS